MTLIINACLPTDALILASIHHTVFSIPPIYRTIYKCCPSEVLARHQKAFINGLKEQEMPTEWREVHYLKVVDDVTGEIVAYAIWIFMPRGYSVERDPQAHATDLPDGANVEVAMEFKRLIGVVRGEDEGRRRPHWLLSLLGTHPNHERRGAAGMLIRWAFERADAEGLPCYVDSSRTGHALYERCGFRDVGEMSVDLDKYEGGKGLGVQKWKAMVRDSRRN